MRNIRKIVTFILLSTTFVYGAEIEETTTEFFQSDKLYKEALLYRDNKVPNINAEASQKEAIIRFSGLAEKGHIKAMHNFAMLCHKEKDYLTAYYWFKRASDRGLGASGNNVKRMLDEGKVHPSDVHISLYSTWKGSVLFRSSTTINPAVDSPFESLPSEIIACFGVCMDVKTLLAFEQTSKLVRESCTHSWIIKAKTELHPVDFNKLQQPLSSQDINLRKLVYAQYLTQIGTTLHQCNTPLYIDYGYINLRHAVNLGSTKAARTLIEKANYGYAYLEERPDLLLKIMGELPTLKQLAGEATTFQIEEGKTPRFLEIKHAILLDAFMTEHNLVSFRLQLHTLILLGNLQAAIWDYQSSQINEINLNSLKVILLGAEKAKSLDEREWLSLTKDEKKSFLKALIIIADEKSKAGDKDTVQLLYRIAAKQGSRIAQRELGKILHRAQEIEEAKYWLTLAAKQGDFQACHTLGAIYHKENKMELTQY